MVDTFKTLRYTTADGNTIDGKIILSDNIQVFPTANRGQYATSEGTSKPFNIESRLQTEHNLTHISDGQYKTYISSWDSNILKCYICGYYFKITGIQLTSISSTEPTYAYILLKDKNINETDLTSVLGSFYSDEDVLDIDYNTIDQQTAASSYYFVGLFFTTTKIPTLGNYELKLTRNENNTIQINYEAFLPSIESGYGEKSIKEGNGTAASGYGSHAEGNTTIAFGNYSHAEGYGTSKSNAIIFAERVGTSNIPYTYKYTNAIGVSVGSILKATIADVDYYLLIVSMDTTGKQISFKTLTSELPDKGLTTAALIDGIASGNYSHAEGSNTTASGQGAHAEGSGTTASGTHSHAEGGTTKASSWSSHAEGYNTTASGECAHAEGSNTEASGDSAHAEGSNTKASGTISHAEGYNTTANHKSQHVFGEYNIADDSTAAATDRGNYVEIVGNGTASSKSNARALDWDGNEWLAGKLHVGDTKKALGTAANEKLYINGTAKIVDDTTITGALTVGSSATKKPTTLNGDLNINNQETGFKISGGGKTLDIQANTAIKGTATIHAPLTVGADGNTASINIKQNNNKALTLIGNANNDQTITFNGTSTFQVGNYESISTSGYEAVTVGGNSFKVVTRDTPQTVSGKKTFTNEIYIQKNTSASTTSRGCLVVGVDKSSEQLRVCNNKIIAVKYDSNTDKYTKSPLYLNSNDDGTFNNDGQVIIGGGGLQINSDTNSDSATAGALVINGGVGIAKDVNIDGITKISNTTTSISTDTGALVVSGGVGIDGAVVIGSSTKINDSTASSSIDTGALVVSGGIGVGGKIYAGGQIQAPSFYATSDARLKENLTEYKPKKSILGLSVYKYDFINGQKDNIGCLAQELREICPEIVHEGADGYLSIEENKLIYLLIDEVKQLKADIKELKNK